MRVLGNVKTEIIKMTFPYRDPDSAYWTALEKKHDRNNPNLIGYGDEPGLGRSRSHSPSKEGEWKRAFSNVISELSENKKHVTPKSSDSIAILPQIVQSNRTHKVITVKPETRINTPRTTRVDNTDHTKPIKQKYILPERKSSDQRTDSFLEKLPKKIKKRADPFENI